MTGSGAAGADPMAEEAVVQASDGTSLWTVTEGTGPAVLLCHGGPGLWDYLGGLSGLLCDEFRVHRWDQRGCGRSGPADDYGIERAVQDVQDLRTALGVDGKWVVVGHSWGAYLALLTALAHPETTAAFVYISGNGTPECWRERGHAIADERTTTRLTQQQRERLTDLEARARTWDEEFEFRRLKWMTDFVEHSPTPDELEEMATTPLAINFAVNRALSRAELYPSEELLARCQQCEMPALLIHGEHDPRPDIGAIELADHLPNSHFVRINGAGHLPWVEQPDAVAHLVKDFIAHTHR
ncbi:MAG TPA: alpha/beta hydrolase [Nocardioidaceae bacterium]|nr:alpha/beta hydrolase [Nocardioidaceae bacterium]